MVNQLAAGNQGAAHGGINETMAPSLPARYKIEDDLHRYRESGVSLTPGEGKKETFEQPRVKASYKSRHRRRINIPVNKY